MRQGRMTYLDSKIHDDDAPLDILVFVAHPVIVVRFLQWNLEHRPVIPLILVLALANLLDDPGIQHGTSPALNNLGACNCQAKAAALPGDQGKAQ